MDIESGVPLGDEETDEMLAAMPDEPPKLVLAQSAPSASVVRRADDDAEPPLMLRSVSEPAPGYEAEGHLKHSVDPEQTRYIKDFLKRLGGKPSPYRGRRNSWFPKPVPLFHCGICLENESSDRAFFYSACTEQHRYCKECLASYARVQIRDGIIELMCPHPDACSGKATDAEVACLVDDELYKKYLTFKEARKNPNMRVCAVCSRHCYGSNETPSMVCDCGAQFCFIHDLAHPDVSCQVYASRVRKTEQESDKLVRRITKKCPQCKADTIKNGGCNHMTCVNCRADWCWICNRVMESGHYDNSNILGCPGGQFRAVSETNSSCALCGQCTLLLQLAVIVSTCCWFVGVAFFSALFAIICVLVGIPSILGAVVTTPLICLCRLVLLIDLDVERDALITAGFLFAPTALLLGTVVQLIWGCITLSLFPVIFPLYFNSFVGDECGVESMWFKYFAFPAVVVGMLAESLSGDDD